jgi:ORF6N domain-containing protein
MRPAVSAVKQLLRVVNARTERIESSILLVRGHKVLLDADLAALYGVETRVLNQAVKRNRERFPADFMFPLSAKELEAWRSHAVMSNPGARMGLRRAPFAFTEHGALMAATVLNSPRAVETSVYVVRAFIRLRQFLATHKDLARRLEEHERKLSTHDQAIAGLMNTIRTLMAPPEPPRRRPIGFVNPDEKKRS